MRQSSIRIQHFFYRLRQLLRRWILALAGGDEGVVNRSFPIDEEHRRPGDVVRVESPGVPHAVLLRDLPGFIDQDLERQADLLDVPSYRVRALRDDGNEADATAAVDVDVSCQFTELAAAVRSPGAAVEGEQDRPSLEELRHRAKLPFLVAQLEQWRPAQGRLAGHQNNFTSTVCPASMMSV